MSESFSAEHRQAEPAAPPASQFAYQAKGKAPKSLNMPTGMQAGRKHITVASETPPQLLQDTKCGVHYCTTHVKLAELS